MAPNPDAGLYTGIAAALAGAAGAIPTTASGTTDQNTSSTQNTSGTSASSTDLLNFLQTLMQISGATQQTTTGTTSAVLTPEEQALMSKLVSQAGGLQAPSLGGYVAGQTANINAAADAQSKAVDAIMASRGLSTSPVAATAQGGVQQNRINQITGMQQQAPLLLNQLQLANLAGASNLFGQLPKGTTTTGTQAGTSTQTQTGTQTGQQTGSTLANQSGMQTGTSATTGTSTQTKPGGLAGALGGAGSVLASVLPFLFLSDARLKTEIKEIPQDKAIDKIRALRSAEWAWKGGGSGDKNIGFIAQDVEKVLPDLVKETPIGYKAINYAGIIPYLVGAVQNLDKRVGG